MKVINKFVTITADPLDIDDCVSDFIKDKCVIWPPTVERFMDYENHPKVMVGIFYTKNIEE